MSARVLVSIVTYNSAPYLQTCFESLKAQTCRDFRTAVWDNGSGDETAEILESRRASLDSLHFSKENIGFCAAHNRLIASEKSDYVLVLNPDTSLDPRFLEILVGEMDRDTSAGSATGKLWRLIGGALDRAGQSKTGRVLDSTGIYMTPSQRHFDRASGEIDRGQYEKPEYVFGASGAAAFYRRAMLEDIRSGDEYFDQSFFAYREDADLAWRAQWMGWRCLYIPEATAYHARRVLPERRASLPDAINMHSFKNRFLLRAKNMDLGTYLRFFIPITVRDIGILAYVLAFEWSSLPGIRLAFRALPGAWAMRKSMRMRRRVPPSQIRSWFSFHPVAKPPG
jgi:GT2 family glycosyltransferase